MERASIKRVLATLLLVVIFSGLGVTAIGLGVAWSVWDSQHAFALTSQDVSVNATPAYVSISNTPDNYDFGTVAASATPNTGNGYFTITNSSTVNIDVSVNCTAWSSAGSTWTYNDPGEDTGNLDASSADGGVGGSTGAGNYDISIPNGAAILLMDGVTSVTNPTWEIQLDAPSSYTHGDEQTLTITISAVAE